MNKNIFKKVLVIIGLVFVFSFVSAEEEIIPATSEEIIIQEEATSDPVPDVPVEEEVIPDPTEETPVITKTDIHLSVISGSEYLYDGDVSVSPCDSDNDINTIDIATPYCALNEAKVESEWNGLWINSIGGIGNDNTNWIYWMWMANLDFNNFNLSSKQYELKSGDNILFYFNTTPLNISGNNKNPEVGSSIRVQVSSLGFDALWNPVWIPVSEGSVLVGEETLNLDSNGEVILEIKNLEPFNIVGQKVGFINTSTLNIIPKEKITENENTGNIGGSSGGSPIVSEKEFSLDKAFDFLFSHQEEDGSYSSSMYTDWVALALSLKNSPNREKIKEYIIKDDIDSDVLTDYERHAMALMSLGINPYDGTKVNYIEKIVDSFDGNQFGDPSLINDDIFAIIVLKNAGFDDNDEIIKKDIEYIISKQNGGSWGSIDMTAAGLMALDNLENLPDVSTSISFAKDYIISNQDDGGDFGNPFSTSWVLQTGLNDSKIKDYLTLLQSEDDGGMKVEGDDIDSRIWATSYAIPAFLNKNWDEILNDFNKKIIDKSIVDKSSEDEKSEIIEVKNILEEVAQPQILETKEITPKVKIKKNLENIKDKKVTIVDIPKEALVASAVYSTEDMDINSFKSMVYSLFDKIIAPFVWLWVHFGF